MSKRTNAAYTSAYKYIHENILTLECRFAMSDYELAMRNGLRSVVPSVDVNGCQFHYAQALNRVAKRIPGLLALIYNNPQATVLYRKLLYLPLLPADRIIEAFNAISLLATNLFPGKFNSFLQYIQRQWLTRVSVE